MGTILQVDIMAYAAGPPVGDDAATTAWVAAVVSAGGTVSTTRKGYVNTLITGLKADGIWSKLDRLWLFAAENTTSALIDLKGLAQATAVNSPNFITDVGYASDGSTSYIDTGFNPSTAGGQYTTNTAHLSVWSVTSRAADSSSTAYGANDGTNIIDFFPRYDTRAIARTNEGAGSNAQPNVSDSLGHYNVIKSSSGSSGEVIYLNGAALSGPAVAGTSAIPNYVIYVCARNDAGSRTGSSTDRLAMFSVGGVLTATEASNFYSRLLAYMVAGPTMTNAETDAWIKQVRLHGGTVSSSRRTLVDTLIGGLKTDGVWSKLDRLWLFAAENTTSALIDLVANSVATTSVGGSPTFTVDRGYDSAVNRFIDSSFIPATAGGLYSRNDAHFSVWDVTSGGSATILVHDNGQSQMYTRFSDGNAYPRINAANAGAGYPVANTQGFTLANRTALNATEGFKDGASIGTDTQGSVALSTNSFIYGQNSSDQYAGATIGASLSSAQALALYTRLRTYMTAVGVP